MFSVGDFREGCGDGGFGVEAEFLDVGVDDAGGAVGRSHEGGVQFGRAALERKRGVAEIVGYGDFDRAGAPAMLVDGDLQLLQADLLGAGVDGLAGDALLGDLRLRLADSPLGHALVSLDALGADLGGMGAGLSFGRGDDVVEAGFGPGGGDDPVLD